LTGLRITPVPVEPKLYALTLPRGPGKRQIKEREKLIELAESILKKRISLNVVGFQHNLLNLQNLSN